MAHLLSEYHRHILDPVMSTMQSQERPGKIVPLEDGLFDTAEEEND